MTSRTRILFLGLLLLAVGLVAWLLRESPGEQADPATSPASTSGGAGEPLTLSGFAPDAPTSTPPTPELEPSPGPAAGAGAPPWPPDLSPQPSRPTMRVRGRLLEHDGKPALVGIVSVRPLGRPHATGNPETGTRTVWLGRRPGDGDGAFEVRCDQGTRLELVASTPGGHPQRFERVVDVGDVVDIGDLRLEAGALLEGRVLFGGKPSEYGPVMVWVTHRGAASHGGHGVGTDRSIGTLADGSAVTSSVMAQSDETGTWRVTGLTPGPYRVSIFTVAGVHLHDALHASAVRDVTAPAHDVEIDLQASLVHAVPTTEGRAADIGPLRMEVTDASGRTAIVAKERQSGPFGLPRQADPGRELLVAADSLVNVRLQGEGLVAWRREVRTASAGGTLRIAPELERAAIGRLVIALPAAPLVATPRLPYRLFEPGTSLLVQEGAGVPTAGEPHEARVPVGTWDLELGPPTDAPPTTRARQALPQRESVTITESTPARVVWDPPLGARLRVHVEGDPKARIRCLLLARAEAARELTFSPVYEWHGEFQGEPGIMRFPGPLQANRLHEATTLLRPGPVTIRLEADASEPLERHLLLEPGQVHTLKVEMTPR